MRQSSHWYFEAFGLEIGRNRADRRGFIVQAGFY
jgi:hypothetical protein